MPEDVLEWTITWDDGQFAGTNTFYLQTPQAALLDWDTFAELAAALYFGPLNRLLDLVPYTTGASVFRLRRFGSAPFTFTEPVAANHGPVLNNGLTHNAALCIHWFDEFQGPRSVARSWIPLGSFYTRDGRTISDFGMIEGGSRAGLFVDEIHAATTPVVTQLSLVHLHRVESGLPLSVSQVRLIVGGIPSPFVGTIRRRLESGSRR